MQNKLFGKKVYLSELRLEDAQKLYEYSREPELNEFSGPYKASESLEKAKEYILDSHKNISLGNSYIFGIYESNTADFVGTIGFFDLDVQEKCGEIGFWTAKKYWGKGYMTEAVRLISLFVFNELKFNKIIVHFNELNKAVEKILIKAGYVKKEVFEQSILGKNGKLYSDIVYEILSSNANNNHNLSNRVLTPKKDSY